MNVFELKDRVAIVTGGGGTEHGTGRIIAMALADAGVSVVLAGRLDSHLASVAKELNAQGAHTLSVPCDVTDPAQCADLVATTVAELGRLDILVNNAATALMVDPLELTEQQWRDSIDVNLNGVFFSAQAAARHMIEQGHGHIVNIASSSGIKGDEHMAPYAAAKAAVINLTRTLATSWAIHNINVNCIAPGSIAVPDHDLTGIPQDELLRQRAFLDQNNPPIQQPGSPDDIADAVLFFASDGAAGMTGETLPVRGAEWASAYS